MLHAYPQSTHHKSAITHLLATIPTAAVNVKPLVIAYPTSLPPYQPASPTPPSPIAIALWSQTRQENDRRSAPSTIAHHVPRRTHKSRAWNNQVSLNQGTRLLVWRKAGDAPDSPGDLETHLPPYRYRTLDRNESPSGSSARVLVSALLQAFVSHPPSRASSPVPPLHPIRPLSDRVDVPSPCTRDTQPTLLYDA